MKQQFLVFALAVAVASTAGAAGFPGTLNVTFRTMDCDGATGIANVNPDSITRVQPHTCSNGRQLKQVLTRATTGTAEVFTIAPDEAPKIEAELNRVRQAREKALEQSKPIVIERR